MKAEYNKIEIEVIRFETDDVIVTSNGGFYNRNPETGEVIPYRP